MPQKPVILRYVAVKKKGKSRKGHVKIYKIGFFFLPMPPHVLLGLLWFPTPGCGCSVTDF
jgi:hypothetical protein